MLPHMPWYLSVLATGVTWTFAPSVVGTAVNVALEASFNSPPYLLELLETAAQENSSSYFPLLDRIADGYFADLGSEEELYARFVQVLKDDGHLSNSESLSTFQLALSLHAAAPRIEAHYQYYNTTIASTLTKAQDASCPVWVHLDGKQYCSPDLERAQQGFDGPNEQDLPFDRSTRIGRNDLLVSTLYADISSPLFGQFHQVLTENARSGKAAYRVRYRPSIHEHSQPLRVSGYGVELQLKRTDYIVIDDRDADKQTELGKRKAVADKDIDDVSDLKPLSVSELLGLGLKTSSHILESVAPFDTLLKVSQDFPKYSSSLASLNVTEEFTIEHAANRKVFLPEGYNVLWMNGLPISRRQMDAYALLERLRQERALVHGFEQEGLTPPDAIALMSHSAITESRTGDDVSRYDWRDSKEGGNIILWLNNIEKDTRYAAWSKQAVALLQRTHPGQMPSVRRDIHNLVVPLDLNTRDGIDTVINVLYMLVRREFPVRFGFVPTGSTAGAKQQTKIIYHLRDTYGLTSVIAYLEAVLESKKTPVVNEAFFKLATEGKKIRKAQQALPFQEVVAGAQLENYISESRAYLERLGATGQNPPAFINGVPVAQNDQWLQVMSGRLSADLQTLQQRVYTEGIADDVWLAGEFLADASSRRNPLVVPEDEDDVEILRIGSILRTHAEYMKDLPTLQAAHTANVSNWVHVLVIADETQEEGRSLIETVKSISQDKSAVGIEAQIIENGSDKAKHAGLITELGFSVGQSGLIVNGRRVGPLMDNTSFPVEDLLELLKYERRRRVDPVIQALTDLSLLHHVESPRALAGIAALVALSVLPEVPQGIYDSAGAIRMDNYKHWQDSHTVISVGDNRTAAVQIVGSIDPTSETAQRWIPIIKTLSELDGVFVKLFLNPKDKLAELPIKRFYRYVLSSRPEFSANGDSIASGVSFEGLPREALLNLGLDVPPAWLVSPKSAVYDLDNLKLSTIKTGDVQAIYELESILIEGHSKDVTMGTAPRGAQLILGTESDPQMADTLVMANLGYFQFKANPGYWNIQLKSGQSADIFSIDSIDSASLGNTDGHKTHVALLGWQGKTIFPRFSRNPGKEEDDVLARPVPAAGDLLAKARFWGQSLLSKIKAGKQRKHADINIFSVASGHLYERMLNIMMVSVMKNTKHTVKFWFIEQFLSPSFKSTIHFLADAYGFEYELVTYKWPHWLRSQTEKQREIWGYKILFLDVLFPLDLEKVIFVDSDQIVRTDMYDLVTHDLEGAPYGFTPMCDSRTEMEGFRFWKQGYWKNFLHGLPYHISALYVVDLKRFRELAAGDRLRGQYHQLSADPNSLSNLDQDLPNNMQMQLPIHSLPQEWLWCETWCSDESLKDAKTIDLCNNPLTKEPKLDRARRQVPEWNVYDEEIAEVFRRSKGDMDIDKTMDGANVQEELDRQDKRDFDEKKSKEKDEL